MRQVNLKGTILSHIIIRRHKKPYLEELIKDYSHFNVTISRVAVVNNTLEKTFGVKSFPCFWKWGEAG